MIFTSCSRWIGQVFNRNPKPPALVGGMFTFLLIIAIEKVNQAWRNRRSMQRQGGIPVVTGRYLRKEKSRCKYCQIKKEEIALRSGTDGSPLYANAIVNNEAIEHSHKWAVKNWQFNL